MSRGLRWPAAFIPDLLQVMRFLRDISLRDLIFEWPPSEFLPGFRWLVNVIVLLLCVLGLRSTHAAAQTAQPPLEAQLAEGTKLLDGGRYPEAIGAFNNAKQIAPQDGR